MDHGHPDTPVDQMVVYRTAILHSCHRLRSTHSCREIARSARVPGTTTRRGSGTASRGRGWRHWCKGGGQRLRNRILAHARCADSEETLNGETAARDARRHLRPARCSAAVREERRWRWSRRCAAEAKVKGTLHHDAQDPSCSGKHGGGALGKSLRDRGTVLGSTAPGPVQSPPLATKNLLEDTDGLRLRGGATQSISDLSMR